MEYSSSLLNLINIIQGHLFMFVVARETSMIYSERLI